VWRYPLSVFTAQALANTLGIECLSDELKMMLDIYQREESPQAVDSKTPLWKHQYDCYQFCYNLTGAMIAMDMGVGKTKCAIDLICNHKARRVLVVGPLSVLPVWPLEFAKHGAMAFNITVLDYGDVKKEAKVAAERLKMDVPTVIVVNYEAAWREPLRKVLLDHKWDYVVADECVPADTMISTPIGDRPIQDLKIGDTIYGYFDGRVVETRVNRTFERESDEPLYQIDNLHLTGNHPVWTTKGYKNASAIGILDTMQYIVVKCKQEVTENAQDGNTSLPVVRQHIRDRETLPQEILRQVLFGEVAHVQARVRENIEHGEAQASRSGEHGKIENEARCSGETFPTSSLSGQPVQRSCCSGEGETRLAREGLLSGSWWEWQADSCSASIIGSLPWMENRVCLANRQEKPVPVPLQVRYSERDFES
jgi:hypothetical protein